MTKSVALALLFIICTVVLQVSGDACGNYGLGLSPSHACECKSACSGSYCNARGFVETRLGLSGPFPAEATLCPLASEPVCCCSCPNCPGFIDPNAPTTTGTAGTTSAGTTAAGTTAAGTTAAGTTAAGTTAAGTTAAGTTAAGTTTAGTTAAGTTSAGTTSAGTTSAGTTSAGTTSAGTTSAGTTSAGTTSAGTTAAGTTAAGTTSAGTTSAGTTSAGTTAAGTTSAGTTSAGTTVAGTTSAGTTSAGTTAAGTTSAGTTSAGTTVAGTTSAGTTVAGTKSPTVVTDAPTTAQPTTAQPTTLTPTMAPTYRKCNTTDAYNIAFLLDESGSVSRPEWQNTIELVDRLIQLDISAWSYVTLYEFSSRHGFDHFMNWTAVEDPIGSGDRSPFTDALYANRYNLAGMTYTWEAVNRVLDDFWDYRSTCTDLCDRRSDVLIILTDGRPTDQVCPNLIPRLNQTQIDVVVVGVNMSPSEIASIACLDVRDGGVDIFSVPSYSDFDLRQVEIEVRNKVCDGTSPLGASERPPPGSQWDYGNGTYGLGPVPQGGSGGGSGGARDT